MSHFALEELNQAHQKMREGELSEALKKVLELEKKIDITSHNLLSLKLIKARIFSRLGEYADAIKYASQVLKESQKQGDSLSFLDSLLIQAYSFVMMGDLNQSNTILGQAEELFESLIGISEIDLKERESFMFRIRAIITAFKGDLYKCIKLNERALELAKDSDDKRLRITSLINLSEDYQVIGDYDKAMNLAKKAVKVDYPPMLLRTIGYVIDIYLSKGDVSNAKDYFQQMEESRERDKSKKASLIFQYYKALMMKTSLRARDRIKAEDIFIEIADGKEDFILTANALINICDLLLIELTITNNSDIIDEITTYITKLLNFAEQNYTFFIHYFLADTYLLNAKLQLLTFNIKKAKRFMTQAQQISSRTGYTELSKEITKEYDNLLNNEDLWKKLKEEDAPMADRVALARLHEQIEGMIHKPSKMMAYIRDERVTITKETNICLVCRSRVLKFTYICKCGAIYCVNCARALSKLENVCWNCEAQIDAAKPIKLYLGKEPIRSKKTGKK